MTNRDLISESYEKGKQDGIKQEKENKMTYGSLEDYQRGKQELWDDLNRLEAIPNVTIFSGQLLIFIEDWNKIKQKHGLK